MAKYLIGYHGNKSEFMETSSFDTKEEFEKEIKACYEIGRPIKAIIEDKHKSIDYELER